MSQRTELLSYTIDFVSYLISKIEDGKINKIILHGSVARGDFDEESDIDLFIDTNSRMSANVEKIKQDYVKTHKFKEWQLKGIEKEFSIIAGKLDGDEWKSLKRAIMNTGIILYGKYKAEAENVKQCVLFSFENIRPDKKRIAVFRKLYGFNVGKKRYDGLVDRIGAVKIGKGGLLVPIERTNELKQYFQEKKVVVKLYDVWID
ncbi:nucleotidyltransferase domain-containing protein [Candidatus Pacearchaeota archaeon]|nr:nucleotidyltransferase domain-containing protein [Candidatus Pacearchaeota archaeon]